MLAFYLSHCAVFAMLYLFIEAIAVIASREGIREDAVAYYKWIIRTLSSAIVALFTFMVLGRAVLGIGSYSQTVFWGAVVIFSATMVITLIRLWPTNEEWRGAQPRRFPPQ